MKWCILRKFVNNPVNCCDVHAVSWGKRQSRLCNAGIMETLANYRVSTAAYRVFTVYLGLAAISNVITTQNNVPKSGDNLVNSYVMLYLLTCLETSKRKEIM